MFIQNSIRSARLTKSPRPAVTLQDEGDNTPLKDGFQGAAKGALYGSAAGVGAALLMASAAVIYNTAQGETYSLAEIGQGMLDSAMVVAPYSAAAGAGTGALTTALGKNDALRSASLSTGAVVGAGTLGYAVYQLINSMI